MEKLTNILINNIKKVQIMKKVFLLFCLMLITGALVKAQTVNVTFQADMRVAIATGYFNPATDTLTCPGDFVNWLNEPPANTEKVMSDDDNDSIYTITIAMAPNSTYGYKFNIGLGWDGKDENQGDRSVVVGASDMTLDPYFFNNYTPYTGTAADVIFSVDMRGPAQTTFDPSTNHVFIAGDFTTWGTNAIEMDDLDGDSVYSVGLSGLFNSGDLAIYKFIYSATDAGGGTWESPAADGDDIFGGDNNRIYGVVDGDNFVSRLWDNKEPTGTVTTGDGNIFFEVDMSVATELGVFDPNVDSVQIRGSFNGWSDSDPARSLLNQNPADPNNWFLDIPFINYELSSIQHYKYFLKNPEGDPNPYSNTGWEVSIDPSDVGNRDRPIVFEGEDAQEAGLNYFEGIHPDWVIPAGTTVECEFSVDMTYATLADTQGTNPVFNPGTDSVIWIPQHPFYFAVNGFTWEEPILPRALVLTDPDQDMIYTGTLTINGPSFNGFLYTYAYISTSGTIAEEASQLDMRVRFIGQTGPRMFESPYTMPLDIWSNSAKPEEEGPVTSVRELPNAPLVYSLKQNYPNPFNPATKIRFSVAESGLVTLKVYNLLGQEVATLLNNELKSGSYEVDFDAASYSSGVYFYTITANNYKAAKKMILMK